MGKILRLLVRKILVVKLLLGLSAGLIVILLADPIATAYGYRDLRRLLPVLAPLVFLDGAYLVLRFTLFGLRRFRSIWLLALANNLLKLAVVFTLWRLGEGVYALVVGLVGVQILTVAGLSGLILRFLPRSGIEIDGVPTYRKIWSYVLPLFGARIFFLSGQHLNKLILGILLPAHALGIASFALLTIERFIALAGSVPNALLPALSRLRGEGREERIEQVVNEGFRLVTGLAVLLAAGIFCLSREAVLITGGLEYHDSILPLQILALIPFFRTIQQPLTMSFYPSEKTGVVFWLAGLKFVVEPLAYPFLIPKLGVPGVALASLLSSIVVFGPALKVAGGLFPGSKAPRLHGALTAWAIGLCMLLIGWLMRESPEPFPGLPLRIGLLIVVVIALLLVRVVNGEDLRRLGEASHRQRADAILRKIAVWVDRFQGRPTV